MDFRISRYSGSTREGTSAKGICVAYTSTAARSAYEGLCGYSSATTTLRLYPNRIASKFLRNLSDCISSLITSLAAAWEFCCFLFGASTLISHLVFISLQGRKMTGVYTGTGLRRGFECWAGHLFYFIFFIHKKIKYFLFFIVLKEICRIKS